MKTTKLFISIMLVCFGLQAQDITFVFTASYTCAHADLDSIWIENLTQGGKIVFYYPDTVASFVFTNIHDFEPGHNNLYVSQNYPNPFSALTYIDVYLPRPDAVSLNVYDLTGRQVAVFSSMLEEGMHRFSFSAGMKKAYLLTVTSNKHIEQQIMLQMGTKGFAVSGISYIGASAEGVPKATTKSSGFIYNLGDGMRFTGFVTDNIGNIDYEAIEDTPIADTIYFFDIANAPPAQPSEIQGEDYVPVNETGLIYQVEDVEGLSYLWIVPAGWEITEGQGSHLITVNAGTEGGDISVTAENNCGMSEASVLSVDVYDDPGPGTVTDIDGNVYQTVIIGNQEWMAENLRVTKYNNGEAIPTNLSDDEWGNTTSGAYVIYPHEMVNGINSTEEMVEAYGKLYNWFAADDQRGLCPAGWYLPGKSDWEQLLGYVVAQGFPNQWDNPNGAGNALKSCRQVNSPIGGDCNTTEHPRWNSHSTHHGFDEFGFSALPAGRRNAVAVFAHLGIYGYWWTSTEYSPTNAWSIRLRDDIGDVFINANIFKRTGYSVRCVKD